MKILVVSDTHGDKHALREAILRIRGAEVVIHCGDGEGDLAEVKKDFPDKMFVGVKGNCDFYSASPATEAITIEGKKIFITHGHLYNAKYGLMNLAYAAREQGADLVCFGHTHNPTEIYEDGLYMLNPGSCHGYNGSFAVVDISSQGIVTRIVKL